MTAARPRVITAGAARALLVARTRRRRPLTSGGAYGLVAAIAAGALSAPIPLAGLAAHTCRSTVVLATAGRPGPARLMLATVTTQPTALAMLVCGGGGAFTGNVAFAAVIHSRAPYGIRGRVFRGFGLIWQPRRLAGLLVGGLHAATTGICAVCYLGGALLAAVALAGVILRGPGSCGGPDVVPTVAFGAVLAPGEPDQEGVEDGQQGQTGREVDGGDPVELVGDEGQQQADQPRVGP